MTELMRGVRGDVRVAEVAEDVAAPTIPTSPTAPDHDGLAQSTDRPSGGVGLEVRGARVVYEADSRAAQATVAVDDVDLTIAPGEIVALLGPSGCGKSSLLRAIAGIEPLAGGTIAWNGRDVGAVPVHRRGFGLLFQDGQLFPHRSVAGNVAYGIRGSASGAGRVGPRRRAEAAARVRELLELVGLAEYDDRPVTTLSGGEKQRVALARSLAPAPSVLLLDEPLSALDRSLRERLAVELRDVLVATGTTALFVTHDHDEAFTVADRVAVMSNGRILQIGTPAQLWNAPASREVAEFLGYEAFLNTDDGALVALAPHALRVVGRERDDEDGRDAIPDSGAGTSSPTTEAGTRSTRTTGKTGIVGSTGPVGSAGPPIPLTWSGQVLSTVFRRGSADVTVHVGALGTVTVTDPFHLGHAAETGEPPTAGGRTRGAEVAVGSGRGSELGDGPLEPGQRVTLELSDEGVTRLTA